MAAQQSKEEEVRGGLTDLIMIDVCPISLGIELKQGTMSVLIPRNTSVPTSMTKEFTNSDDN